jgi:hypothetical protein
MSGRRQRHRLQARRTLLWMVAFVALAEGGVGAFLNTSGWRIRFPEMAGVVDKWRAAGSPDVVAIGTSSNGAALNEGMVREFLDRDESTHGVKFVNACISCGDAYVMDRLLRRVEEEHLPLPRLILLEMSPELLSGSRFWSYRMHALRQFTWQESWEERTEIVRSGDIQRALMAQFSPLFVHRRPLRIACSQAVVSFWTGAPASAVVPLSDKRFQLANQGPPPPAPLSVLPVSLSKADALAAPKSTIRPIAETLKESAETIAPRESRWLKNYRINADAAAMLKRVLDRCRRNQVDVIVRRTAANGVAWRPRRFAAKSTDSSPSCTRSRGVDSPISRMSCRTRVSGIRFMSTNSAAGNTPAPSSRKSSARNGNASAPLRNECVSEA